MPSPTVSEQFPQDLADWNLFIKTETSWELSKEALPYELNMPLFTDYASKARHIIIPPGEKIEWEGENLIFPKGTVLAKTFFYNKEEMPGGPTLDGPWGKDKFLIETRILYNSINGWLFASYAWDRNGQATLVPSEKNIKLNLSFRGTNFNYVIPSKKECLFCHRGAIPLGPQNARNIPQNTRLKKWMDLGILEEKKLTNLEAYPQFDRAESGTLIQRAHAYLHVNCAHCHNPHGSAAHTMLFLENDRALSDSGMLSPTRGFCKESNFDGNNKWVILPGAPHESGLIERMEARDQLTKMPVIGRDLIHFEGVELLKEYVRSFSGDCEIRKYP